MKTLFYIFLFHIILPFGDSDSGSFSTKITKLVQKQVDKTFKTETNLTQFYPNVKDYYALNSTFYYIRTDDKQLQGIAVITHANGCILGGCSLNTSFESRFEKFYLLNIYNTKKELSSLIVLDYPGEHGYEISAKWWLKQFLGEITKPFVYRKNIDAISGATVSAQSVVTELNGINTIVAQIVLE
ncbi:MAG: FMN-binding protein [Bacteroidota bacterium]|jgi:Na+-translocating ferredoxin:NAD+ oxidoreductase RnfG subunit